MVNLEQIKADIAARKAMPAWGPNTSIERIKTINVTLPSFSLKTVEALIEALEKAQQRIAELESRAVKLPKPHAHLIWIQAGHAPDDYWDDVAVSHSDKDRCCDGSERYPVYARWEIKEALSAIGINIAAAGKGEDS